MMEDVDLMQWIKKRKVRIHISTTAHVKTSGRRWEKERLIYSFFCTWILALLSFLGWPLETLAR